MGAYLCSACFAYISFIEAGFCTICQRQTIDCRTHPICKTKYAIDGVFSSIVYVGVVKRLVYQFKYKPYVSDLKDFLVELAYEGLIQKEIFYNVLETDSVVIPIPLYKTKLKSRGYNQSALLAKGLAKRFSLPVVDALERVKNTQTQVGLSQEERKENIKDAFEIKNEYVSQLDGIKQVFLIDDIVTSGATLNEAAKLLKRAGVKRVWGVTLAHGQ
jgi:competence protein ComFC